MSEEGIMGRRDVDLLRVAPKNLPGNAWKLTGKKPEARVESGSTPYDETPAYYACDEGGDLDMVHAGKLFGTLQHLHGAGQFEGTGTERPAARRVIRRHGGGVRAEGEMGRGATFYFTPGRPESEASLGMAHTR